MTYTAWHLVSNKSQQIRHAGRWHERVEAMFPRYLSIQLDANEQRWVPIRSTVGSSWASLGDSAAGLGGSVRTMGVSNHHSFKVVGPVELADRILIEGRGYGDSGHPCRPGKGQSVEN